MKYLFLLCLFPISFCAHSEDLSNAKIVYAMKNKDGIQIRVQFRYADIDGFDFPQKSKEALITLGFGLKRSTIKFSDYMTPVDITDAAQPIADSIRSQLLQSQSAVIDKHTIEGFQDRLAHILNQQYVNRDFNPMKGVAFGMIIFSGVIVWAIFKTGIQDPAKIVQSLMLAGLLWTTEKLIRHLMTYLNNPLSSRIIFSNNRKTQCLGFL